jgi:hypothetical protein
VVQNEKRQGENQPYGRSYDALLRAIYPEGHPYHHTVIGSMNDLERGLAGDVKTWFRSWYGPNNAVLVLAGDIDLATAKAKVTRYFGDIPASATLPKRADDRRAHDLDPRDDDRPRRADARDARVERAAVSLADVRDLQLFAQVLGGSRSSRLDKRLSFGDKTVDRVSASSGRVRARRHLRHQRRREDRRGSGRRSRRRSTRSCRSCSPRARPARGAGPGATVFKAGFVRASSASAASAARRRAGRCACTGNPGASASRSRASQPARRPR